MFGMSFQIETSQLICAANPSTCFYMRATLVFDGLRKEKENLEHTR